MQFSQFLVLQSVLLAFYVLIFLVIPLAIIVSKKSPRLAADVEDDVSNGSMVKIAGVLPWDSPYEFSMWKQSPLRFFRLSPLPSHVSDELDEHLSINNGSGKKKKIVRRNGIRAGLSAKIVLFIVPFVLFSGVLRIIAFVSFPHPNSGETNFSVSLEDKVSSLFRRGYPKLYGSSYAAAKVYGSPYATAIGAKENEMEESPFVADDFEPQPVSSVDPYERIAYPLELKKDVDSFYSDYSVPPPQMYHKEVKSTFPDIEKVISRHQRDTHGFIKASTESTLLAVASSLIAFMGIYTYSWLSQVQNRIRVHEINSQSKYVKWTEVRLACGMSIYEAYTHGANMATQRSGSKRLSDLPPEFDYTLPPKAYNPNARLACAPPSYNP